MSSRPRKLPKPLLFSSTGEKQNKKKGNPLISHKFSKIYHHGSTCHWNLSNNTIPRIKMWPGQVRGQKSVGFQSNHQKGWHTPIANTSLRHKEKRALKYLSHRAEANIHRRDRPIAASDSNANSFFLVRPPRVSSKHNLSPFLPGPCLRMKTNKQKKHTHKRKQDIEQKTPGTPTKTELPLFSHPLNQRSTPPSSTHIGMKSANLAGDDSRDDCGEIENMDTTLSMKLGGS